jgi:hypothetical protein
MSFDLHDSRLLEQLCVPCMLMRFLPQQQAGVLLTRSLANSRVQTHSKTTHPPL